MSHFVLADCNNFFVSCEKLFNPKLEGRPVVVLSSNDGCVVSRSQEAKRIGIKMGQPYFQIKDLCSLSKVAVFSSNYRLYGDLSERMMNVLSSASPDMEVYSVDEAFLNFSDSLESEVVFSNCVELRARVKKWVGLPISLGVAPTKTLAKIAGDMAKRSAVGVFNLSLPVVQKEVLQAVPVHEVWGVGSKLSEMLRGMGIRTAWDFREADLIRIRKKMGVMGERIVLELRGVSCLGLEEPQPKKSIICSRSFGQVISKKEEVAEALSTFASAACETLREQGSYTCAMSVWLEAVLDAKLGTRRHYSRLHAFAFPTSDTPQIITAAKSILSNLFIPTEQYKKCGIVLLDLISEDLVVPDLFLGGVDPKRKAAMKTLDAVNEQFGKKSLFFGAMGTDAKWKTRSDKGSQYNTVEWDALPIVKA